MIRRREIGKLPGGGKVGKLSGGETNGENGQVGQRGQKIAQGGHCLFCPIAIFRPWIPLNVQVYVGVDDLSEEFKDEKKKFLVDYIISHKDGYKGEKDPLTMRSLHK